MQKGIPNDVVVMDFAKAFDKVAHNRLLGIKNSCVSTNPTDPVSNTRLLFFLSVKMQNKKSKAPTLDKIPAFS